MALIEVQEREKSPKNAKIKQVPVSAELEKLVERYRDFLVTEQGADPKLFGDVKIMVILLEAAMKGDKDFQRWMVSEKSKKNASGVGTDLERVA